MFTPGSGARAAGPSGLIIVALAPGTSAETVWSSSCWSVAVTVAMPKWLAIRASARDPVDVAAGCGELAEPGGRRPWGRGALRGGRPQGARRRRGGRGTRRRGDLDAADAHLDARRSGGRRGRQAGGRARGGADRRGLRP